MKALRVVIDLDQKPARDDVAAALREVADNIESGRWEVYIWMPSEARRGRDQERPA